MPLRRSTPQATVQVLRPADFAGIELELATQLPPTDIPKLAASGVEFFAVERGSAMLRYRGQRYNYRDARRLFSAHSLEDAFTGSTQAPSSYRSLRLSGQTADELASTLGFSSLPDIATPFAPDRVSPHLFALTSSAVDAFTEPHPRLERELRLLRLLGAVFGKSPAAERSEHRNEHRAVNEIRAFIHAHPDYPLALSDLTRLTGLNGAYAAQVFKQQTGVTPNAYQQSVRVERAKHSLTLGEDAVQVAQTLGFADQSHFIRIFKRYVYVTPGRFQRDNRAT